METPSSARRVTRSQALISLSNSNVSKKVECSEYVLSQSRRKNTKQQDLSEKKQQDRSVLVDITNDSPIVGLAMGSLETPLSTMSKQRSIRAKKTPGSGEALLRGQVKSLLQKVEEEAEFSKLSLESRPFLHLRHVLNSPIGLLAPTPANTPQIPNLPHVSPSEIFEEKLISKEADEGGFDAKNQEILESDKNLITTLDFSENTESIDESSVCFSGLTYEGGEVENESAEKQSTIDDDDSSIWSIQVNASSTYEEEEDNEEEGEKEQKEEAYENEEDEEEDGEEILLEELCRGMNGMSVNEKGISAMFEGKHTRFVYDSDDEVVEEEVGETAEEDVSPSVVRLKGLPTPQGKHLRFLLEDEDMDA